MRKFLHVPADTTCTKCGTDVPATPEGQIYSRQTVVTFDDSSVSATYCSNRCVNEDNDRLVAEAFPAEVAMREVRKIKAPTKRAARIAAILLELPTQEAVMEFTAQLRREAGVQDVELLPATTWNVQGWDGKKLVDDAQELSTDELVAWLKQGSNVRISWPSVTSHWGVSVSFDGMDFGSFVARSRDWQLTETYLSM